MNAPAVVARGLELRYGSTVALESSDFLLPNPGLSVIIGPNGSGKSSVLAAIAGLHDPSLGEIEVLGRTPGETRARVAFVPQSTKVNEALPVTVREVVTMGRYASLGMTGRFRPQDRQAVESAIDRLDLGDLVDRHIGELSGGQRQRVFVAQGLVQDRDLLLMDEPTMALDLVSSQMIRDVVSDEVAEQRPVVMTTHDMSEAMLADHVLLLSNRVVAEGLPDSVLTPENIAVAYHLELGEGRLHLDDAAHRPVAARHVHTDPHNRPH